jgi:hypothetical protein
MATSAGHVSGKSLIACEAATWLNEHFLATLSEVKQNADRYLTNGVNHIVYHGTPYSPASEPWPGWLFTPRCISRPPTRGGGDLKAAMTILRVASRSCKRACQPMISWFISRFTTAGRKKGKAGWYILGRLKSR